MPSESKNFIFRALNLKQKCDMRIMSEKNHDVKKFHNIIIFPRIHCYPLHFYWKCAMDKNKSEGRTPRNKKASKNNTKSHTTMQQQPRTKENRNKSERASNIQYIYIYIYICIYYTQSNSVTAAQQHQPDQSIYIYI
jgi:hypothetical protein